MIQQNSPYLFIPLQVTLPMHDPFGYLQRPAVFPKTRTYGHPIYPDHRKTLSYSFTATFSGKLVSYLPVISSCMAIYRVFQASQELLYFQTHQTNPYILLQFQTRSLLWITRALIESVPIAGNLTVLAIDLLVHQKIVQNIMD